MKKIVYLLFFIVSQTVFGYNDSFSTAGFYPHENNTRQVAGFNTGWKFFLGNAEDASSVDFDDSAWDIVALPHTLELLPASASGGRNYQGIAWYRKTFTLNNSYEGKKIWLYFEAIMGKCRIYLNGKQIKEHYGGFLPIIIDLSEAGIKSGEQNVICVCADNSNDPSYPPGKPQEALDFCYFGGIYRDCWLYTTSSVHITDANYTDVKAGGGIFVSFDNVSEEKASVRILTHIVNETVHTQSVLVKNSLIDNEGNESKECVSKLTLKAGEEKSILQSIVIKNPKLWHPDSPNLYDLETEVRMGNKPVDGLATKIGIRSIQFVPDKGLFLNGKHFEDKLLGGNRHQDFGYIGMALSNNLHYTDAFKLREAGFRVIRSAHYPQDPAFMDACDKLGLFVIVATPGWQFWNNDPVFENRVISDIRNMIRRDRNHPCVLLWEPVLNETHFPESFARKAYLAVHEEYPYKGCYAAIDDVSKGSDYYDILYCAPKQESFYRESGKCCFTREFGDCVDDWYSHNSYSRIARDWSEEGLLHQAQHYAKKNYEGSLTVDQLYKSPPAHIGGTLWHSFDHQRGYHPDPFWGGIMDAFRQPKYAYYMFKSQSSPLINHPLIKSEPFVFIAHSMTPTSPEDVTVYSNCDSVRLIVTADTAVNQAAKTSGFRHSYSSRFYTDTIVKRIEKGMPGIPNSPLIFEDAFSFVTVRALHRSKKEELARIIAEGMIDGRVVASSTCMPSKRSDKINLSVDNCGLVPQANGSDIVLIIASIVDERGYVRRLANENIEFFVEGEGEIIGNNTIGANPCAVKGGIAPLLIRTTTQPGLIKIIARLQYEGANTAQETSLTFNTEKSKIELVFDEQSYQEKKEKPWISKNRKRMKANAPVLQEVEKDQQYFESTEKHK